MEYSAAFTKEGWFEQEIRTVVELYKKGLGKKEILDQIIDDNLFQMRSVEGIKTRFQMVYRRANTYNDILTDSFLNGTLYDKKALLLYSFLKVYRIPYEFFMEVIVSNYQSNKETFQRGDFHYFFEKKEMESEKVRKWRQETKNRLINSMILFFREGGLISETEKGTLFVTALNMSPNMKFYARDHDKLLYSLSNLKSR